MKSRKIFILTKSARKMIQDRIIEDQYSMREAVEDLFKCQGMGLNKLIRFLTKKVRVCFNHGSFFKTSGPCFKNQKEENFLDPKILTPLNRRPSRVAVDEMIKSDMSAKEDVVEHSKESSDALKIAKAKTGLKDKIDAKDPQRITCADYVFKIVLLNKGVVEVDEFSFRVQYRTHQIAFHSTRTYFTQTMVAVKTQFFPGKWSDHPKY